LGKKTGEPILGVVGGLLGTLAGVIVVYLNGLGGATSSGMAAMVSNLGYAAIVLGILGFIGGAIVGRYKNAGGALMLLSGFLGFLSISFFWILAGILLIAGGILTFKKPSAMKQKATDISPPPPPSK
jgi:hypothetical protein